ncbi:MAG: hypothetical protein F6J98_01485 [Moorea sp. SIO4G2]|nr:hypothetical protein [Moorena sp. SIO4G2]
MNKKINLQITYLRPGRLDYKLIFTSWAGEEETPFWLTLYLLQNSGPRFLRKRLIERAESIEGIFIHDDIGFTSNHLMNLIETQKVGQLIKPVMYQKEWIFDYENHKEIPWL